MKISVFYTPPVILDCIKMWYILYIAVSSAVTSSRHPNLQPPKHPTTSAGTQCEVLHCGLHDGRLKNTIFEKFLGQVLDQSKIASRPNISSPPRLREPGVRCYAPKVFEINKKLRICTSVRVEHTSTGDDKIASHRRLTPRARQDYHLLSIV